MLMIIFQSWISRSRQPDKNPLLSDFQIGRLRYSSLGKMPERWNGRVCKALLTLLPEVRG
jgi:hypothetical protein